MSNEQIAMLQHRQRAFSEFLMSLPAPVRENIEASVALSQSFSSDAFVAGYEAGISFKKKTLVSVLGVPR